MCLGGFIGAGDYITPIETIAALIVWFNISSGENYHALVPIFALYVITGATAFFIENKTEDHIVLVHLARAVTTLAFIGSETNRETVIFLLVLNAAVFAAEKYRLKSRTNCWYYFLPAVIFLWFIPYSFSFGLLNPVLEHLFHEVPKTLSYIGTFIQSGILAAVLMTGGLWIYKSCYAKEVSE